MKTPSFVLLVAFLCLVTTLGVVLGNGSPVLAFGPAVVFALMYAVWKLPLRWPFLILAFMALTLENPADVPAQGLWKSPLYTFGALMLAHMNVTLPYKALFFSGLDIVLIYLFWVSFWRAEDRERVPSPRAMRLLALASLGGAACMWAYGLVRGGADFASSLWQVQRVAYLPVLLFGFQRAMRPEDAGALGKVLVAAACLKACVAIYVRATVPPPPGEPFLQYATTHADSMLFAGATCTIVALLFMRRDRRHALRGVAILALLVAGMVANQRRLVWVELTAGLTVVFALTPWTPAKRTFARTLLVASPFATVYCAAGWGSSSGVFRPVQIVRSLVDSDADASTTWRDWENYDLFYTIRDSPLLGIGYGHGYIEHVKLPDVASVYALERFVPHNSILGLWAYGGLLGFTALWSMFVAGVFFGARAYRHARTSEDRVAALVAVALLVIYSVHCYGDMGLGTWVGVFTVAPALALSGQLAVATGAWSRVESIPSPAPIPIRVAVGDVAITTRRRRAS